MLKKILVLGGTGFVGRHVCEKASLLNCRLTVPTRRPDSGKSVLPLPWVDVAVADVHDEAALTALVRGHDAVINLVAILHGNQDAFTHVHVTLPQKLVRACQATGVRRVVHVSALGAAASAPSMYQRSKAQGEAALLGSGLDLSILRPSVIFGAGDQFMNLFARLQSVFPVMPLAGAHTRFQPVWVEDVAQALVQLLLHPHAPPVLEAVGPDVFTLKQLVQLAGQVSGHERLVVGMPMALGRIQARMMELAPGIPLMSRDNLDSMQVDNIATPGVPGLQVIGIQPSALAAIAPSFLRPDAGDQMLNRRRSAGRL
jgi:NADH dehydrogenase